MSGRMFTAVFEAVDVSAVQDLFEIVAPTNGAVEIHEIVITADEDETNEQLPVRIRRGATSTGTGGSTLTPKPTDPAAGSSNSTVKANNTTQASGGTIDTLRRETANFLGSGYRYLPTPETRIGIKGNQRLTVGLPTAPAATKKLSGTIVFEEFGT